MQSLHESAGPLDLGGRRVCTHVPDRRQPCLLRLRRQRPRRRAAEQQYELTPFQLTELHAVCA
jgi:hypothetical protein